MEFADQSIAAPGQTVRLTITDVAFGGEGVGRWNDFVVFVPFVAPGETVRAFPLSNWTELDIWTYIQAEGIEIVDLYFAKDRPVVERDGVMIMVDDDRFQFRPGEKVA